MFLLLLRVDLSTVTEEVTETPLEIAATNKNVKAFNLLAPHYEENDRKKIAQLMIWALTDKAPSPAFMLLFESIPLAEVTLCHTAFENLMRTLTTQLIFCLTNKQSNDPGEQSSHPRPQPAPDSCLER